MRAIFLQTKTLGEALPWRLKNRRYRAFVYRIRHFFFGLVNAMLTKQSTNLVPRVLSLRGKVDCVRNTQIWIL